jgi:hypothetical protein
MWTRDDAKHGKKTRTCTRSKAIEDKESQRWVDGYRAMCKVAEKIPATKLMSVADREADFYEMFYEAAEANNAVELLIRSRCDRVLEDGGKLRARVAEQHQGLSRKLRGHFAYYGITGNGRALSRFREPVVETWFQVAEPSWRTAPMDVGTLCTRLACGPTAGGNRRSLGVATRRKTVTRGAGCLSRARPDLRGERWADPW